MARIAQINEYGGPDVIGWVDADLPDPAPGEIQIRSTAVGLNFIDTYHRRGIYPTDMPTGLGIEAAAVVEAVGDGVSDFAEGDRVATFGMPLGAYATHRNIPADMMVVKLPDDIDDQTAAAAMVKGCTAEFLAERCGQVQPGWTVLVHAAAGGTGLLLVQWLKHMGATVIGTVSSEEKAAKAIAAGADHIIFYQREDTSARVWDITDGAGVRVVFDGVGMATWEASLDSCGTRGLIINFGNADAPVGGVDLGVLAIKGSLYNTRPTLWDYYAEPADREAGCAKVFDMIRQGIMQVSIGQTYALEDAAAAHADLQGRKTIGSTVLLP